MAPSIAMSNRSRDGLRASPLRFLDEYAESHTVARSRHEPRATSTTSRGAYADSRRLRTNLRPGTIERRSLCRGSIPVNDPEINSTDAAMDWERFRDEVAEMQQSIQASKGSRVILDTEALIRTFSIVHRNAKELVSWVREGQEGPRAVALQSQGNEADLDEYLHELTRKLHNFVASVGTLVAHSRRLVRRLFPDGLVRREYDEHVAAISDSMEHQVLQALRNHTLHYALPGLTSEMRIWPNDDEAPVRIQFGIDVQSVLRSDFDLTAKQREAMEGMETIWLDGSCRPTCGRLRRSTPGFSRRSARPTQM